MSGPEAVQPTEEHQLLRWERRTEWPLAVVALIFLAVYSIQVLAQPVGHLQRSLEGVVWITYFVFVVDYFARLALATNRRQWFLRHLLDLAIVALPLIRPLRLLRLLILLGALQRAIGNAIRGRVVVYTAVTVILLVYSASLAILQTERYQPGAKITTFDDALWWAITTVTTVGYGDLSPVTGVGRVIAVVLMLGGISLVGVVTATVASWIVQRVAEEDTANQAATSAQIEQMRAQHEQQNAELREELRRLGDTIAAQRTGVG